MSNSSNNLRSKYETVFHSSIKKLNPKQKEAVDSIEGPVLVNAGPGTGKTQILATRIGKILYETDSAPHNILCLTFTEAATIAMRNRLVSIIGPVAHQIHIYTFHGFCNQVIQENLDIFGDYRQLEAITDLEAVDVFRELIDGFKKGNILKRYKGDKYFEKDRLKNLFNLMKNENLSLEFLTGLITKELEDAKENPEFLYKTNYRENKKGDLNKNKYNRFETSLLQTKAAVEEFDKFNEIMMKHERYDYADMILWVLREFQKNEALLIQYQERYHYFLVDEYQDTNGAQNAILNELISYWDQPNVFVVGDDDQAIYKFQGANLGNLLDFKNKYNPKTIVLTENYRSNQKILDATKTLIENNKERIIREDPSLTKNIIASGDYKDDQTLPKIHKFNKISEELTFIASEIEQIKDDSKALSQTAIIYRQHKQVAELIEIFEKRNIAYNVKKRIDILKLPFVKKLINILNYILEEYTFMYSAPGRLFDILHYDFFDIKSQDIAKIFHYASHRRLNPEGIKLRDIISDESILESIGVSNLDSILSIGEKLESWIKDIPNVTIQKLFENILNEGNILSHLMKDNQKAWLLQLVGSLFDLIKNETAKNPDLDLDSLLAMIDKMKENKLEQAVNKNISSEKGVHFVTAHSAKGLEFKNVYIIGCTDKFWNDKKSSFGHYKYPEGINTSSESNIEDERRLFYVAMTRAMTNLNISFAETTEEGKPLNKAQFIDEILEYGELKVEDKTLSEDQLIQFYYDIFKKYEKIIPLVDGEIIDEWLKDYKLSVTHLNKYLRCPLSFYFENILRVPSARNASTGYGSAMHDALRAFLDQYNRNKQKDLSYLIHFFKESMKKYKSHFTQNEYDSYQETGINSLTAVYEDRMEKWLEIPKIAMEEELSHAEVNGIPIKGFLDKVEIYEHHVHVVDYKTGKAQNGLKKTKAPNEKNPNGGDYWRQLVFYKILLDSDKKHNWNMTSAEIDFLEPDRISGKFEKWIYNVNPEDIKTVSDQISDCHEHIVNHNFNKGCGEEDCNWCNFVEENNLIIK